MAEGGKETGSRELRCPGVLFIGEEASRLSERMARGVPFGPVALQGLDSGSDGIWVAWQHCNTPGVAWRPAKWAWRRGTCSGSQLGRIGGETGGGIGDPGRIAVRAGRRCTEQSVRV